MKKTVGRFLFWTVLWSVSNITPCLAGNIGIDAIHVGDGGTNLATGFLFEQFRSVITGLGHSITPLTSFEPESLAGLDAAILMTPYMSNAAPYTPSDIASIHAFADRRAAFVSDSNLWNPAFDRPISFGGNQKLLENIIGFISARRGALFIGEDGGDFDVANMNALVGAYGISYSSIPTDPGGRTVSNFVPHPVTNGLTFIGVDFQLPMTVTSPAIDLTVGSFVLDNVIAIYDAVPEPASSAIVAPLCLMLGAFRTAKDRTRRQ